MNKEYKDSKKTCADCCGTITLFDGVWSCDNCAYTMHDLTKEDIYSDLKEQKK